MRVAMGGVVMTLAALVAAMGTAGTARTNGLDQKLIVGAELSITNDMFVCTARADAERLVRIALSRDTETFDSLLRRLTFGRDCDKVFAGERYYLDEIAGVYLCLRRRGTTDCRWAPISAIE